MLNTGGPVLMPWLSQVKGVLEAWYPGQEDGNAIAALLFGDVDPSGKLPETFPSRRRRLPTQTAAAVPGRQRAAAAALTTRGPARRLPLVRRQAPDAAVPVRLRPLVHDASLRGLAVRRRAGDRATVSFDVTNTGTAAGAEVAQLYVADPRNTGEPPRQLKGFDKVVLNPGGRHRVALELNFRSLAHWSVRAHRWKATPGCYGIRVGDSSRDLPLAATVAVERAHCRGASVQISSKMLQVARRAS